MSGSAISYEALLDSIKPTNDVLGRGNKPNANVSVTKDVPHAIVAPVAQPTKKRKRTQTNDPNEGAKFKQDRLGKIVAGSIRVFRHLSSWSQYVQRIRGRSRLADTVRHLRHKAAGYLDQLRQVGTSALVSGPDWSSDLLFERLCRGPHKLAVEHSSFVREEMADFCDKGFWTVLPFELVKDLPGLKLSPLGVVPQRERRPRLIVDLSYWGINDDTVRQAPSESMQFGRAFERLMFRIRNADPAHGPVYICKLDISDGFYRIPLEAATAPALAVLLPQEQGEATLVAIPLSLPMGWVESPPYFCAATETIADVANQRMSRSYAPPHRLEEFALIPTTWPVPPNGPGPPCNEDPPVDPVNVENNVSFEPSKASCSVSSGSGRPAGSPVGASLPEPSFHTTTAPLPEALSYVDVYMDDFISLVQGNRRRRRMVRRILMNAVDEVFRRPEPSEGPQHKEPLSVKKMKQGDASWETLKIVLGWLVDTIRQTIRLPAHREQRLREIFDSLRHARRVSIRTWHKVLGELRSMLLAIPGGKGLFSILQTGFRYADRHRVRLDAHMHAQLDDFETLVCDLAARPTRLAELISGALSAIGSVDASGYGMGGVWFTVAHEPLVWRERFPDDIVSRLVSSSNPTGDLTNSDFELTGVVAHQDILAQEFDIREASVSTLNDNTPAVSRSFKGSVTTRDPAAYLLRLSSLHRRHYRYNSDFQHISGPANAMADDASPLSSEQTVANVPAAARDAFRADLRTAQETSRTAVVSNRVTARDNAWDLWTSFCLEHSVDPLLDSVEDPIHYLMVFAVRYRDGRIAADGHAVRSRTVEDVLRAIGQTMASLGSKDHRLIAPRVLEYRLSQLQKGWKNVDPPPDRVKPVPFTIVRHAVQAAHRSNNVFEIAVADMSTIGFFYLNRPGEHTASAKEGSRSTPFRLQDVVFFQGARRLPPNAPFQQLYSATFALLTYSDQKNAVRGETIGHGRPRDPLIGPVQALARRVQHLRQHHSPPSTPLYTVYVTHNKTRHVKSEHITTTLRRSARQLYNTTGIDPSEITAKGLRPGGAMALLCAKVDSDVIRLVGRWRSDEMFRYLHPQAYPLMHTFAQQMMNNGAFTFAPGQTVANAAVPLLNQVPAAF